MQSVYTPPLFSFVKRVAENGGIPPKQFHRLLVWAVKLIAFEPLRLAELALYHRSIEACTIRKPPLFILGHYRSGTTYLQRLLVQDRQFGYQNIFHSGLPEIMLGFETVLKPVLAAATRLVKAENKFHKVPFTWDFPGEEDVALTAFCCKDAAHWGVLFPDRYSDYFSRCISFTDTAGNAAAWKKNYSYLLKKLYIRNHYKRLVLKNPPNTARIPLLLQLFPDAQFIFIYRNPYDVFASSKRFWQIINRYYAFRPVKESQKQQLIIQTYSSMMNRYLETKQLIPSDRLVEVQYEALAENPLEQLSDLYGRLDLGDFSMIQPAIKNFVEEARSYKRIHYSLTQQEKELVDNSWQPFLSLWK